MIPPSVVLGDEIVAEMVSRSRPVLMPRDAMLAYATARLEAGGHNTHQQGASYLVWRACSVLRRKAAK